MKRFAILLLGSATLTTPAFAEGEVPKAPAVTEEGTAKSAAEVAQEQRARVSGRFNWVGGEKEVKARDAAIDKGIESLFFAIRGIARGKIKSSIEIRPQIGVAFRDGKIITSASGKPDVSSPDDGKTVPFKGDDGKTVKLSQGMNAKGHLVQAFQAEEGGRTAIFAPSADGKTLRVTYKLSSPKLSNPIVYTLTYRRAP